MSKRRTATETTREQRVSGRRAAVLPDDEAFS